MVIVAVVGAIDVSSARGAAYYSLVEIERHFSLLNKPTKNVSILVRHNRLMVVVSIPHHLFNQKSDSNFHTCLTPHPDMLRSVSPFSVVATERTSL